MNRKQEIEQEKYKRELLQKRQDMFEQYKVDPLLWLEERFGEPKTNFLWSQLKGYEDHKWDGDKDPLATAWRRFGKSYQEIKNGELPTFRYVGIEAGTGTSKTYMIARLVFWFLDCFENSLVVTSAPKQDQLKLGLWSEIGMIAHKVKKLRPNSSLYKLRLALDETKVDELDPEEMAKSDSWHAIGFVAGTGAEEQSASRAKGFHRKNMMIILEECTGVPAPVITAFQNTSTGLTNFIIAVGNPESEYDPLHQFCQQKDVLNLRVSALDYPNVVLNKELFEGAVTQASINSRTDVYGEGSPLWNAMVRGLSPKQGIDSLIRSEWIEACINTEPEEDIISSSAVGIDVANSIAGDKAALAWGEENILKQIEEFQCPNATHLAYNVVYSEMELELDSRKLTNYNTYKLSDFDIQADFIGIDAVGVGVATVNAFIDLNMDIKALQGGQWDEIIPEDPATEKPLYKFRNLRSQMYWELREDIRKGLIGFKVVDKQKLKQLIKELCIPRFIRKGEGILIESKEDIKKRLGGKSPNMADAAVYWNWVRKGYRVQEQFDYVGFSGGS